MAHHIRILTVHTTDMSHKLLPLKRLSCSIRPGARVDGVPVTDDNIDDLIASGAITPADIDDLLDDGRLRLSQTRLDYGSSSIECEYDDTLSSPYIIGAAMQAEQDGCSAVVIDCVGDPALHAAREAVRIPVVGAGEAAMHMAAILGHRFGIVTITNRVRPILDNHMRGYGVYDHCCSVRAIEVPGIHIPHDPDHIHALLADQSLAAVVQDEADVIMLGCTAFFGASRHIADHLARHGKAGVPIIDPLPAAVMTARSLLDVGLSHSLATYPPPPVKPRTGYRIPDTYHRN